LGRERIDGAPKVAAAAAAPVKTCRRLNRFIYIHLARVQVLAFQVYNNAHPNHDRNDARQPVRFKSPAAMADLGQNADASEGMESTTSPGRGAMGDGDTARHVASPHCGGGGQEISLGSLGCICAKLPRPRSGVLTI